MARQERPGLRPAVPFEGQKSAARNRSRPVSDSLTVAQHLEHAAQRSPHRRLQLIVCIQGHVDEALEMAVADAFRNGLSVGVVAAHLGIPRSTCYSRFGHLMPATSRRSHVRTTT
jgi:hypothetical protein